MKLPNFRLYDTQATAALAVAVLGLLSVVGLCVVVLWRFDAENMVILYNPKGGVGQYRPYLVYGFSAVTFLLGVISAILGFNSLGQKRNKLQGRSWLGMTLGALAIAVVPILYYTWSSFSEPLIHGGGG